MHNQSVPATHYQRIQLPIGSIKLLITDCKCMLHDKSIQNRFTVIYDLNELISTSLDFIIGSTFYFQTSAKSN